MPALARPASEQQLAEYQSLTQAITIVSLCAIAGISIKSGGRASNLVDALASVQRTTMEGVEGMEEDQGSTKRLWAEK
jgi:hypothetical protein